jgi:hypothetical protein
MSLLSVVSGTLAEATEIIDGAPSTEGSRRNARLQGLGKAPEPDLANCHDASFLNTVTASPSRPRRRETGKVSVKRQHQHLSPFSLSRACCATLQPLPLNEP